MRLTDAAADLEAANPTPGFAAFFVVGLRYLFSSPFLPPTHIHPVSLEEVTTVV